MFETFVSGASVAQSPARAPRAVGAEAAQIDARLELAAKKAALADLEAQARNSGLAEQPAVASTPTRTITIEKDGNVITLINPTREQLEEVGVTQRAEPDLKGWEVVGLASVVLWAIVGGIALILWHRRRMRGIGTPTSNTSDARMARIENAVESIAVEVERISEGQRYTSRMLADGAVPSVAVPHQEAAALRAAGERQLS